MTDETRSAEEIVRRTEEIKARCEAATAGSWVGWHKNRWENTQYYSMDFGSYEGQVIVEKDQRSVCSVHRDNDVDFFAHAREDIPYLLQLVETQAAEIAELRRRVDTKETLLRLQETTMSMLSSDKDTLIHKLHKLQAQLTASQQRERAAVEFIRYLDREYSHYIADRGFEQWRRPQEAGEEQK